MRIWSFSFSLSSGKSAKNGGKIKYQKNERKSGICGKLWNFYRKSGKFWSKLKIFPQFEENLWEITEI